DWSSDVCSSDLLGVGVDAVDVVAGPGEGLGQGEPDGAGRNNPHAQAWGLAINHAEFLGRGTSYFLSFCWKRFMSSATVRPSEFSSARRRPARYSCAPPFSGAASSRCFSAWGAACFFADSLACSVAAGLGS